MEILQLILVAVAGFLSVRFLYKKFFIPSQQKAAAQIAAVNNLALHQTFYFLNFNRNIPH